MNVCHGYETMNDKAKLAKLDELIADYQKMMNDPWPFNQTPNFSKSIDALRQERAEVASRIGKTK